MNHREIPENAIGQVAKTINDTVNRPSKLSSLTTIEGESETPHYFEIIPFTEIDNSDRTFYAIDGSYNYQEFYNGICIGIYTAGYIGFQNGKQVTLNNDNHPIIKGKSYFPQNIMITNDKDKEAIFDELFSLEPIKKFLDFLGNPTDLWGFAGNWARLKQITCENTAKLFSFCQTLLEWSLIYEIANLDQTKEGDFILRDGNLRPLEFEQKYLKELGKFLHNKGIILLSITKNSAIKLHLSSTFKHIDDYLQTDLKYKFPFIETDERKKKICCWVEVSDFYLEKAFPGGGIIYKKHVTSGRGFGLYFVARLDYVEKLQNYDWLVADLNIYDAIPGIENRAFTRDINKLNFIFKELTRLTQEHYILGYPYPLAEAHNFVTLKKDFKQEIINRVKISLYVDTRMEHVDIENLFLDIHDRF